MDIIPILEEFDLTIFCGDLLGYGKDIDYCLDYVLNNVDLVVAGNHERLIVTGESLERQLPRIRESVLYTKSKLSAEQIKMLSSLPNEIWYKDLYITHSIGDDYLRTENDIKRLRDKMHKDTKYALFGHTHERVLFNCENKTYINPGSISMRARRGGFHRGYCVIQDGFVDFVDLEDLL